MNRNEQMQKIKNLCNAALEIGEGVTFPDLIRALSGFDVLAVDKADESDCALIQSLIGAARRVIEQTRSEPLRSGRVNEVGNKIEPCVADGVRSEGLRCESPRSPAGRRQTSGYPDLLIFDNFNRPTYIECKTYNRKNAYSTFRAFYLSPSAEFKVAHNARHILMGFEVEEVGANGGERLYRANRAKLVSLHALNCGFKLEFQNSNRDVYRDTPVLAEV